MIALPKEQGDVIVDYLAKNFPEQPKPKPVLLSGNAKVAFKEWNLPTLGSRPHDPLATRTARSGRRNVRQRARPGRSANRRDQGVPLKTPQSGPHGLTVDKDGKIWFTANSKGYIGKLDPATGEITEYKLPEAARDPHTPLFDSSGVLWFTVQGANMTGRLDPKTGEVKVVTYPEPRSLPYGMVFTSKGVPVIMRIRLEQDLANRSGHHGDQGVGPAERRLPAAPYRDHERRRRVVCRLFERLPGTPRYLAPGTSRNGRRRAGQSRSPTASRRSTT